MIKLTDCDPKLRERIQKQIQAEDGVGQARSIEKRHGNSNPALPPKHRDPLLACNRIKTPEEELNKTERSYLNMLRFRFPYQPIMIQSITLRLAHNTKYTPDFAYTLPTGALVLCEVKGAFVRDDAMVKLKTAANKFPQFTFIKAQYKKGQWTEQLMPK